MVQEWCKKPEGRGMKDKIMGYRIMGQDVGVDHGPRDHEAGRRPNLSDHLCPIANHNISPRVYRSLPNFTGYWHLRRAKDDQT